jgi:hypothetical protein
MPASAIPERSPLKIDGEPARIGERVAAWHQTYATQWDPVPGTITNVGRKYLTVDFDDHGPRRIEPRNVTRWSESRDV